MSLETLSIRLVNETKMEIKGLSPEELAHIFMKFCGYSELERNNPFYRILDKEREVACIMPLQDCVTLEVSPPLPAGKYLSGFETYLFNY